MSPDKDKLLVSRYPYLYRDRFKGMISTAMCWGFECGDGWFDLIDTLSSKLEPLIVANLPNENPEDGYYCAASQVKEKFGGLRFYMRSGTEEMWDLISRAEDQSFHICEDCGKPGETGGAGWLRTLCEECRNDH